MSFLPSSASTLPFLPTASTPSETQAILQSHVVRLTEGNEELKRDKTSFTEVGDEARRTVANLERENEELRRVVEIGEEKLALRKKVEGFEVRSYMSPEDVPDSCFFFFSLSPLE
jgi:FtsZ-binding cell division protein ZapB